MRHLRTLLVAIPLVCAAPALASAQDFDRRIDEDYREYQAGQLPWTGPQDVRASAEQLAGRANQLAQTMRNLEGYSPLSTQARRFARTASIFARSVRSGAPYPQVVQSFQVLQNEYYEMRNAFFQAHRAHHVAGVVNVWTSLVSNYERLALSLGIEENQLCAAPGNYGPYGQQRYGRYDRDDRYGRYDDRDSYDRYPG